MATFKTTTEELTSIADAIRLKGGTSEALVYPTGFVTAIENITTGSGSSTPVAYDPRGQNITKIVDFDRSFKLSTTSIGSYSPSSSNTTIQAAENIGSQQYLSGDYDYFIQVEGGVNYAYTGTYEQKKMITEYYFCGWFPFGKKPNNPAEFEAQTYSYTTYQGSIGVNGFFYYAASGTLSYSNNSYGITFALSSPSFSSNGSSTFGCQLKTPVIRANMYDNYMSSAAYAALDAENSTIYYNLALYQVDTTDLYRYFHQRFYALYQQNHSSI